MAEVVGVIEWTHRQVCPSTAHAFAQCPAIYASTLRARTCESLQYTSDACHAGHNKVKRIGRPFQQLKP